MGCIVGHDSNPIAALPDIHSRNRVNLVACFEIRRRFEPAVGLAGKPSSVLAAELYQEVQVVERNVGLPQVADAKRDSRLNVVALLEGQPRLPKFNSPWEV